MLRYLLFTCVALAWLAADARAAIDIYLDEFDDPALVHAVSDHEKVRASHTELESLTKTLLALEEDDLTRVIGQADDKPVKTYAMPIAEVRSIVLPGLRRADDNRPDSAFIGFYPVGDAAVELYFARYESNGKPIAIRIYLKADKTFPKLAKDNLGERLAWEQKQLKQLTDKVAETSAAAKTRKLNTLKTDLDDFNLSLNCYGVSDKPYYSLHLIVSSRLGESRNVFRPTVQIDKEQAEKIIDHLAKEDFFAEAINVTAKSDWPMPCYVLSISNSELDLAQNLGWNLAMIDRLDKLQKVLEGDAHKAMNQLIGRLSGHRNEWKAVEQQ